jgi:uncharacterized membrane protein YciS (DUF1049 family)
VNRAISWLVGFGRFWYRFIVGDDWTVAAAVFAGLAVTAVMHTVGVAAWWIVPAIVFVSVSVSLQRSRHRAAPSAPRR